MERDRNGGTTKERTIEQPEPGTKRIRHDRERKMRTEEGRQEKARSSERKRTMNVKQNRTETISGVLAFVQACIICSVCGFRLVWIVGDHGQVHWESQGKTSA